MKCTSLSRSAINTTNNVTVRSTTRTKKQSKNAVVGVTPLTRCAGRAGRKCAEKKPRSIFSSESSSSELTFTKLDLSSEDSSPASINKNEKIILSAIADIKTGDRRFFFLRRFFFSFFPNLFFTSVYSIVRSPLKSLNINKMSFEPMKSVITEQSKAKFTPIKKQPPPPITRSGKYSSGIPTPTKQPVMSRVFGWSRLHRKERVVASDGENPVYKAASPFCRYEYMSLNCNSNKK